MIYRSKPTYAVMTNIYDTINAIFKSDDYFYTQEEVADLKNKLVIIPEERGK